MSIINSFQDRFNEKKYIKIRYKLQSTSNELIKCILLIYLRRIENSMNCNTGLGLGTSDSPYRFIGEGIRLPHRLNNIIMARNVKIGDNVDIGTGAVILNNVKINEIVAGNPAKVIKKGN